MTSSPCPSGSARCPPLPNSNTHVPALLVRHARTWAWGGENATSDRRRHRFRTPDRRQNSRSDPQGSRTGQSNSAVAFSADVDLLLFQELPGTSRAVLAQLRDL
eukprot:1929719-Rhodomonas_salina.1